MDTILDCGLFANLLELAHRKYFVDGFKKTDMYSIVDLPQHVLVVAWASSFFGGGSAFIPLFVVVPLTFKAILFLHKARIES